MKTIIEIIINSIHELEYHERVRLRDAINSSMEYVNVRQKTIELINKGRNLEAIKYIKDNTGKTLRESKMTFDDIKNRVIE